VPHGSLFSSTFHSVSRSSPAFDRRRTKNAAEPECQDIKREVSERPSDEDCFDAVLKKHINVCFACFAIACTRPTISFSHLLLANDLLHTLALGQSSASRAGLILCCRFSVQNASQNSQTTPCLAHMALVNCFIVTFCLGQSLTVVATETNRPTFLICFYLFHRKFYFELQSNLLLSFAVLVLEHEKSFLSAVYENRAKRNRQFRSHC